MRIILSILVVQLFACNISQNNYGKTACFIDEKGEAPFPDNYIKQQDSCLINFMFGFKNDTIFLDASNLKSIIANTNESIAYATSCRVSKTGEINFILKINDVGFLIPLKEKFYVMDIYKRSKDSIDVHYSNNLLILSAR